MALWQKAVTPHPEGVRLSVRLTPKSSRDAIQGVAADAEGGAVLRCTVTAVPENGKANQALVKMLAKLWKLPRTSLDVISGATDRRKGLLLRGETAALMALLEPHLAKLEEDSAAP